jgi:5'-3' exonuclease
VPPERIVDYLALVGDTVDGVPGVAKCGPKTAVKWLAQYGSLDGIVAHADEIGGVVGENLRDHLGFLPLGKKLVTVACDLPNLPAPTALTATPRDTDTARALHPLPVPHLAAMKSTARKRRPLRPGPAIGEPDMPARRPKPSRSATKPCSPGRSSTPGWPKSRPPN